MTAPESSRADGAVGNEGNGVDMDEKDGLEFEYEYDENETEDCYFTIDVTKDQFQSTSGLGQPAQNSRKTNRSKVPVEAADKLQVLDLHSDNPLIKLGASFYSCHWSTDLGTQFYISHTGMVEEPLRDGHVLDVVGVSRARLTGTPVTLHRRRPDSDKQTDKSSAGATGVDENEDPKTTPDLDYSPGERPLNDNIARLTRFRQQARDPARMEQLSFLERLAIIKHKKGAKDTVPAEPIEDLKGRKRRSSAVNGSSRSSDNDPNKRQNLSPAHSPAVVNGDAAGSQAADLSSNIEQSPQSSDFEVTDKQTPQQAAAIAGATETGVPDSREQGDSNKQSNATETENVQAIGEPVEEPHGPDP